MSSMKVVHMPLINHLPVSLRPRALTILMVLKLKIVVLSIWWDVVSNFTRLSTLRFVADVAVDQAAAWLTTSNNVPLSVLSWKQFFNNALLNSKLASNLLHSLNSFSLIDTSSNFWWQQNWWHVTDFMKVTAPGLWWLNHNSGDSILLATFSMHEIGHQNLHFDIKFSDMSPNNFVANLRHQHRCHQSKITVKIWDSQPRFSNKTFFDLHVNLCESDFILMSTSDNPWKVQRIFMGFMAVPLIERQSGNNYPNVQLMIWWIPSMIMSTPYILMWKCITELLKILKSGTFWNVYCSNYRGTQTRAPVNIF